MNSTRKERDSSCLSHFLVGKVRMYVRKGQKHPSASWPSFMAGNYLTAFNWYLQRPFHMPGYASNMRTAVKSRNKASVPWTHMSARGCAVSTHRKGTLSQIQMRAWLPERQLGKAYRVTGQQGKAISGTGAVFE